MNRIDDASARLPDGTLFEFWETPCRYDRELIVDGGAPNADDGNELVLLEYVLDRERNVMVLQRPAVSNAAVENAIESGIFANEVVATFPFTVNGLDSCSIVLVGSHTKLDLVGQTACLVGSIKDVVNFGQTLGIVQDVLISILECFLT